jgi:hypothetical protein
MTRDAIAENLFGAASYYRKFTVNFAGSSLEALTPYGEYGQSGVTGFNIGY